MKIALVHDDLVQWGGAERVLVGLSKIFPEAPIYTSVFDRKNGDLTGKFKDKEIITSFLQDIPAWKNLYKALLPLYPLAFEQFDFSSFDLVISQSTRFAKSIITKPKQLHICYCHTPPRFLWDQSLKEYSFLEPYLTWLRTYDKISSARVDQFIAGSENARSRIKTAYGADCQIVYPFVDLDRFAKLESFDGGYFLVIARLNKYKRVDLAIEACAKLNLPLKIIGTGPEFESLRGLAGKLKADVQFLGSLSDRLTAEVLAGAKALIICAKEDFGLTALEAQALGKPVVAYGYGGVLETITEGKTGFFFRHQTSESLMSVLENVNFDKIDSSFCIANAERFGRDKFTANFKKEIESYLN